MVGAVVTKCLAQLPDVVVVDDASTDNTSEEARAAGAYVIRYEYHRGKGGALKTGFQYALEKGFDAVVTLDADGQHRPEDIPAMLEDYRQTPCDLLIGSRARYFEEMLPKRRRANRFAARAISFLSGVSIEDSQSGFRIYSAPLLKNVRIFAEGYDAESEVIIKGGRCGYSIRCFPITTPTPDGTATSYYRSVRDTAKIVLTSARSFLRPG